MSKFLQICLLAILTIYIQANPVELREDFESKLNKRKKDVRMLEMVFDRLQGLVTENLENMYYKLNSFSVVTKELESIYNRETQQVQLGTADDMTSRCPVGFRAVPGDSWCYYLSTYKAPWSMAREHCLQLGSDVDMVSINTTKRQFIITHLIQSDPETRQVKRWWTSGRGTGNIWAWTSRLQTTRLFADYWADEGRKSINIPEADSCIVLDSKYFYQWTTEKECVGNSQEMSLTELPSHHFICERQAYDRQAIDGQ